jgi:hypothetical protein
MAGDFRSILSFFLRLHEEKAVFLFNKKKLEKGTKEAKSERATLVR